MIEKVKKIKKQYEKEWLSIAGVVAIGVGEVSKNQIGLIVSVIEDENKYKQLIPAEVEGIPVLIKVSGKITAL